MTPDEIKELAEFAIRRGATHVRVGEFEMTISLAGVFNSAKGDEEEYDKDEHYDPTADVEKTRQSAVNLLTYSG